MCTVLPVCVFVSHVCSAWHCQKRVLDPREPELQMLVSGPVGAGKLGRVLCKNQECSEPLSLPLSTPTPTHHKVDCFFIQVQGTKSKLFFLRLGGHVGLRVCFRFSLFSYTDAAWKTKP